MWLWIVMPKACKARRDKPEDDSFVVKNRKISE